MFAARRKPHVIVAIAFACLAASLFFQYRSRATIRQRDEQVQRLRERMAQLEDDVARRSTTHPTGLARDELEAYLALDYKAFDATPGSGFRRFRDQPRHPSQAGELIEAYLKRHTDLPPDQWMNLKGHAAQMFALGGMNERAITHLDQLLAQNPGNDWARSVKAFLTFDRAGLLAARQRLGNPQAIPGIVDLIERFGQSYADGLWSAVCLRVSIPADASAKHRAAADRLRQAFSLPVTTVVDAPARAGGGIPGECIWLEVRPMGPTPDVEGYIILHASTSTVITASNEQRLEAAVTRFIESSRLRNDQREVPFGLATSFELAR